MLKKGDLLPILLLALLWTPTFLVIKAVVLEAGPFTVSFIRCLLGALILTLFSFGQWKNKRLFFEYKKKLFIGSLLLLAFPFSACAIGEMFIDGSTAGIVEGAIPVFTLLCAKYGYKEGNIGAKEFGGILLGLLGLLVIFAPTIHEGGWQSFLGLGLLLLMAIGFGIGFVYVEKHLKTLPPLPTTAILLFTASIVLLPLALTKGGLFYGYRPSNESLLLLSLLSTTTALGWFAYFRSLQKSKASALSIATMLVPVLCVFAGWIFLGEPLTWYKLLGTAIVLGSIFLLSDFQQNNVKS